MNTRTGGVVETLRQINDLVARAKALIHAGRLTPSAAKAVLAARTSWDGLCQIRSRKQAERVARGLSNILHDRIADAQAMLDELEKQP